MEKFICEKGPQNWIRMELNNHIERKETPKKRMWKYTAGFYVDLKKYTQISKPKDFVSLEWILF